MDILDINEFKKRTELGVKYNTAIDLITQTRNLLNQYEHTLNTSLEEAENLYVVSEANIDAALEGLRTAHNTLKIWSNDK